jgi:predicted transposase YdaD
MGAPMELDIRKTRVYQEAREEGRAEALKEGIEIAYKIAFAEGYERGSIDQLTEVVRRMTASQRTIDEMVEITGLSARQIKRVAKRKLGQSPSVKHYFRRT